MSTSVYRVLMVMVPCLLAAVAAGTAWGGPDPVDEIWALEDAYWQAIAAGDAEAQLALIEGDGVLFPVGERSPASGDEFARIQREASEGTGSRLVEYEIERQKAAVFGNVVVVAYTVRGSQPRPRGRTRPFAYRFTHTWKKRGGSWSLIGGMGSLLPPEKTEDPRAVLDQARELANQGQYEEALERHIWFHDNALKHRSSLAGVRLSFALSAWLELGEDYPPALEALIVIRDEKAQRLAIGEGDSDLMMDVSAINQHLGESDRTLDLFRIIDEQFPEQAESAFICVRDELLANREYALSNKYLDDPRIEIQELADSRALMQEFAESGSGDRELRTLLMADERFGRGAAGLIEILAGVGRDEDMAWVQDAVLEVLDSDAMRSAIDAAIERAAK